MNNYVTPEIELVGNVSDVITSSPGTNSPTVNMGGGIWDLEIEKQP